MPTCLQTDHLDKGEHREAHMHDLAWIPFSAVCCLVLMVGQVTSRLSVYICASFLLLVAQARTVSSWATSYIRDRVRDLNKAPSWLDEQE